MKRSPVFLDAFGRSNLLVCQAGRRKEAVLEALRDGCVSRLRKHTHT